MNIAQTASENGSPGNRRTALIDDAIAPDLVNLIYAEIWPQVVPLCFTAILGFILTNFVGGIYTFAWFLASCFVFLIQLQFIYAYGKSPKRCSAIAWLRLYTVSSFFCGCVWGAGYLIILDGALANPDLPLMIYFTVHLYMAGGTALTHTAYFRVAEAFIWPSILVPIGYIILYPAPVYMIFGGLFLIFAIMMHIFGHKLNLTIINSIRHEKEKEAIAVELIAANKQLYRAIDAAENANRAKSSFLAAVSHELRTPLNTIIGFSELMIQEVFGPLNNVKYREYSEDIFSSGRHLLELINDILDISKIEAGELKMEFDVIQPVTVIKSCVRLLAEKAAKGGVKLDTNFAKTVPQIIADERRLRQIGFNLISNAIKFTPAGGNVMISLSGTEDTTLLTVADTGVGMRPEDIPIALKPFQQVPNHLSHGLEGTGLGLPLTKNLVEMHKGTLRIESAPGQGTTVYVNFPVFDMRDTMRKAEVK